MKSAKDILFILGLILLVWIAIKLLVWTLHSVILIAFLALLLYVLYRAGLFSRFFRK